MKKYLRDIKELKRENKQLKKLVDIYNSGVSRVVVCKKCSIPLLSSEDRIRVLYNKRKDGYYSDRQIAVFHVKCWSKK